MRAKRIAGSLVAAMVLVGATALPAHAGREYTGYYVVGVYSGCLFIDTHGLCAPVSPDDDEVRIRIIDISGRLVTGQVSFFTAAGNLIRTESPGIFCHRTVVDVPEGAAHVGVSATNLPADCATGPPTTGTITAFIT